MTGYQLFRTDAWTLSLPDDWKRNPAQEEEGSNYFESGDGSKGLYIFTCQLGPNDARSMSDVVRDFKQSDLRTLQAMEGYAWEVLADTGECAKGSYIGVTDCLAASRSYRTVAKILAAPPIVVRAAFQDYACTDLDTSRRYFQPLVESLRLQGGIT